MPVMGGNPIACIAKIAPRGSFGSNGIPGGGVGSAGKPGTEDGDSPGKFTGVDMLLSGRP